MVEDVGVDEVDTDLATAVGLCVIGDVTVLEAAEAAGVTRWELEESLEAADLGDAVGLEDDCDVAADIDAVLDRES